MAARRLTISVLCAAVMHGAAFAVAAVVLSGQPSAGPAAPPPVDVDLVEVTAPRPAPIAEAPAVPATAPAKLVMASRHHPPATAPAPRLTAPIAEGPGDPLAAGVVPSPPAPSPAVAATPRSAGSAGPATDATGTAVSARPRYRTNPKPEYPLPSLRRREEGVVLVNVVVQPDGLPGSISLGRTSGHPLLDRAALEVVRRWTFEPARAAGLPVSSQVVVPVRFDLSP